MPDSRRRYCTVCGADSRVVGAISWAGYCRACGKKLLFENMDGIAAGEGYAHRRRLKGYARMLERAMLDQPSDSA